MTRRASQIVRRFTMHPRRRVHAISQPRESADLTTIIAARPGPSGRGGKEIAETTH